jgi:hypothetical protein
MGGRNPQMYHVTARSVEEPNLEQHSKMLNKFQKAWNSMEALLVVETGHNCS